MRKKEIRQLKISMCRACGLWDQCQVGFSRWLDQKECRFAVKHETRDQCKYTNEVGNCDNKEAKSEAAEVNYGRRKGDIL